jgi:hypothetical protein
MSGFLGVIRLLPMAGRAFMELLGAVRSFEFMALAGNSRQHNGHQQQKKKFHHAVS